MLKSKMKDTDEAVSITPKMKDTDFKKFSNLIKSEFGIKMPLSKKTMLEARLQKRLRALGMISHSEYCNFLFSPGGLEKELTSLIDVVTTNTTDFFREPKHFELLLTTVLPELTRRSSAPVKIWSAGCSSGEEPYTLGIVLSEFAEKNPDFNFSILATDISNEILNKAINAVYPMSKVDVIPMGMKKKYLLKSKNKANQLVRIAPEVRRKVEFRRLNFMESFPFKDEKDIIFCRNVVIYFDRATQYTLFSKFCAKLSKGGFLFIGHSESISGMELPVRQIAPTVYQKI
ncbi:protein-glutamate O-methyltransferase CheR [Maridesulfovibrio ferrireducens]|uniref:CheR family methyltransferase n=1 Tax=Maridesulfovibrio ferrireducens TaxID=246191 RepID=UPI001A2AE32B|nr:protein-glutamate O-methyltransferase [Maridesulfovibrio ferrireducens]MBI9110168.1 protein-glutamate O-methyltransferase [Maridesulfovibrio ferrireducens]